ncbi:MAG: phosphate ABC transporter permease PstA [Rickettsiales bacterium]|nr:phosphate ABC transporter permease PstA [Rickettsiales bacterium]
MKKSKIKNLKKRHTSETRFRLFGKAAIGFSLLFLVMLFGMIVAKSSGAFLRTEIALNLDLSAETDLEKLDYRQAIKNGLKAQFPDAVSVSEINSLYQILSKVANLDLKKQLEKNPELLGKTSLFWLSASSKSDMFFKHKNNSSLNEKQVAWLESLVEKNQIRTVLNWKFFEFADSREPEIAGIGAGLSGSILVMLIFLSFAFPIGVMCAFYLEEFAAKNRLTDIIEISINNLAAIPSIIYGLLGLTVYLQFMNLPRSSSLVGGMTLFMLVLPVIIIATRNTIRSIPSSIRDGAAALGASKMQITLHHLLPLSIPGIMTGTILAISRALGETAPLLMIGMIAFIADVPQNFTDPTTVLPVQIYLWSDSPEMGFAEKTAAAILVLLGFLILFNLVAVILRKKFERKW